MLLSQVGHLLPGVPQPLLFGSHMLSLLLAPSVLDLTVLCYIIGLLTCPSPDFDLVDGRGCAFLLQSQRLVVPATSQRLCPEHL